MTRPPDDLIDTGHGAAFKAENCAPSERLAPWLESFHSYHIRLDTGVAHQEMFLPALASIRLQTYGSGFEMRIGKRPSVSVPRVALFGPSAHSAVAGVSTGQLIGVYLRPKGWAALIGKPADRFADAIIDLGEIWGVCAGRLHEAVSREDDFSVQVAAFEKALAGRLGEEPAALSDVAAIENVLADPEVVTVEQALQRLDMPDWKFARMSRRHFGFTPKLMMRRARFMRTILKIRGQGGTPWAQLVDEAYVDQSHFIRDCRDFLDMTPVQFANRFQPMAKAAFDAREKALGDAHHLVSKPG